MNDLPTNRKRRELGDRPSSALAAFGKDLTAIAAKTMEDHPIIGRDDEIASIVQILMRKEKNNPAIVGDAGVGKTAVVIGLAQKIVRGDVPPVLQDKIIASITTNNLMAGVQTRPDLARRIQQVLREAQEFGNIILFFDEMHTLMNIPELADTLKPSLANGEISCIGATTYDEYVKNVQKDNAMDRRFQPVFIEEPSEDTTLFILEGLREGLERHHKVTITDKALKHSVKLSIRFLKSKGRKLPDAPLDLVDMASAYVRYHAAQLSPEGQANMLALTAVRRRVHLALRNNDPELADLEAKEKELEEKLAGVPPQPAESAEALTVTEDDVARACAFWTKIPLERMTTDEKAMLLQLKERLGLRIFSQDEALEAVSNKVKTALALPNRRRETPIAMFLFDGPSGVGKTELAKAVADLLGMHFIRLDMSEYRLEHAAERLVSSPPGYVGHEEEGQLTGPVRKHPSSVVLLDEIDKAHKSAWERVLQVADGGRLTDGKGRVADFTNTIVFMTANIGSRHQMTSISLGDMAPVEEKSEEKTYQEERQKVMEDVRAHFSTEFLNKITDVIIFRMLNQETLNKITDKIVREETRAYEEEWQIKLILDEGARALLLRKSEPDERQNARFVKKTVQNLLCHALVDEYLKGRFHAGDEVIASVASDGESLVFEKKLDESEAV